MLAMGLRFETKRKGGDHVGSNVQKNAGESLSSGRAYLGAAAQLSGQRIVG